MMPQPHSRGFTLIELLCSMAIASIVLLAAALLLGNTGENYERVGGGVAAEREARAAIMQITSDLSSATFHKDVPLTKSTAAWPKDKLGILSLQTAQVQSDAGRIGDLCAVNYYVTDLTLGGKTVRCLMRGFRESADTFKALSTDAVPSLFIERPSTDEPVAFGVVSFEARPKSRDKTGQWIDWVKNDLTSPEAVDLKIVFARRAFQARLKQPADWEGNLVGQPSAAGANKNLEVYTTRISFGNHATP